VLSFNWDRSPCNPSWTKTNLADVIFWGNFLKIHPSKLDLRTHANWHSTTNNARAQCTLKMGVVQNVIL
jgi:hypothetical protein